MTQPSQPRDGAPTMPLGERLVAAGLVTEQQLGIALKEQSRTGQLLGEILVSLNFCTDAEIGSVLSNQSGGEFDALAGVDVPQEVLNLLPPELVRERQVLPLEVDDNHIRVAMVDTFDVETIDEVARLTRRDVVVVGCPKGAFFDAVNRLYSDAGATNTRLEDAVRTAGENLLDDSTGQTPIVTLVDELIGKGLSEGATDIHIQPGEKVLHVRYRVDGIMRQGEVIPKQLQSAVESRIKIMAGLDISERRLPQDGRIQMSAAGRRIDLRVSTMPCMDGENIVLRLLDREKVVVTLEDLGFSAIQKKIFRDAVDKPNGIMLVTGPTGSGKTTTLYAGLMEIDSIERNVTTLEDPVEYRMSSIRQSQVNVKAGFGFSEGLRALLRQDPDVILVGEMRDGETAELAIKAAMTGHLVLSTLHTNDAASALPRLVEMGITPYLLPSTIVAVVSQRLVRKPCRHCMEPLMPGDEVFEEFGTPPAASDFVRAVGCPRCNDTGYKGRIPISEILCMSPAISELVMAGASAGAIHQAALDDGMVDIRHDGFEKASRGMTTLEEVHRVAERRLMIKRQPGGEAARGWAPKPV